MSDNSVRHTTETGLPNQGFQEVGAAKWINVGDGWFEAREPAENKLMFRFNPVQNVIEWGQRRRLVVARLEDAV